MAGKKFVTTVSMKKRWFWDENWLFNTEISVLSMWVIHPHLRESIFGKMGEYFFTIFGKYTKGMLMNRSVFDQRMKLSYGWVTEVQKGIKLQNNKLPSRGRISRSCVLVKHRIVAFYVPVCVAFHFSHKLLWFLWNLNSSLSMPPPGGN